MTHLTPDDLIDAVEGVLDGHRRSHLDACEACQQAVAELTATLRTTQQVEAPEPSPLFWDHFSMRVRDAVAAEPAPAGGGWWPSLLGWRVLVPVAGLALLVLALMLAVPRPADAPMTAALIGDRPDVEGVTGTGNDDGWQLVADLVGTIDWDTATAAGLSVRPGAAEQAALDLSSEEQRELRRLLNAELARPKS